MPTKEQDDYQYAQERAFEDEQAYMASKSAEAMAEAEAQMEAEMEREAQLNQPTKEQIQWFWEQCGLKHIPFKHLGTRKEKSVLHPKGITVISTQQEYWIYPDGSRHQDELPIDLNNLFKYAPDIIVGVYFRFYPGGCECELTYITEAGFDTEKSWVKNETGDEKKSRELSALALFRAIYSALGGKE